MRPSKAHSCRLEMLEPRQLYSVSDRQPGTGKDLVILSDVANDTTPVVKEVNEQFAKVEFPNGFKWMDATQGRVLENNGANADFVMVNGYGMWPTDPVTHLPIHSGATSEANTRNLANWAASLTDTLVIDIEYWQTDIRTRSKAVVDESIAKFVQVIDWIRDEQPNLSVGIYSILPISDYYASTQFEYYSGSAIDWQTGAWYRWAMTGASNAYALYQNANAYMAGLASHVDAIYPSLYTHNEDINGWAAYATKTLEEARQYGKPVVPFIMPNYHQGSGFGQPLLPNEMWSAQLDIVAEYSSGAVIWSDNYVPNDPNQQWIQTAIAKINSGSTLHSVPVTPSTSNTYLEDSEEDDREDPSDFLIHRLGLL